VRKRILALVLVLFTSAALAFAEGEGPSPEALAGAIDMLWIILTAALVFFMQAGFALVETGLTRAKNASNIVMKNLMDFCFGSIVFWMVGWGLMYGADKAGLFGTTEFFKNIMGDTTYFRNWFFQVVFAATSATIVSGAMAERTQFKSYLVYTVFISALIYPISGHWIWGGGWLSKLGFHDFAGSTVVHSVGGWAAFIGAAILGPRIGKYVKGSDGKVKVKSFPGHNIPFAMLGVFILWFGWYGFNPGSTLSGMSADIGRIAVTTTLAAAAGAVSALAFSWVLFKKPDPSMTMNGVLAGLVAITAPCAVVTPGASIVIGLISGVLVVLSVEFIDKVVKVDDPVGAVSVHCVNGIFGTLAVGIWGNTDSVKGLLHGGGLHQLGVQAIGVVAVAAWAIAMSALVFFAIKKIMGLRVTAEEEMMGLDLGEHKSEAYSGFQFFSNM
jgi:ammonium transporter, Amt family